MMHENIFAPTDRQILIGIFISYGIREDRERESCSSEDFREKDDVSIFSSLFFFIGRSSLP